MRKILSLAALAAILSATSANATPISRTYDITAKDFSTGIPSGGPAPTDPFTASITVTFDPTVEAPDQTTGVTLNSYNILLDSSSIGFNFDTASDELGFGLIENGVSGFSLTTNDFTVSILHPESATPLLIFGAYSDQASGSFYEASDGKVSFKAAAPIPEPSSISLLLAGLGALVLLRLRPRLALTRS